MNILFTGASSFTGYWFIKELSRAGHRILATFTKNGRDYDGIRRKRIENTLNLYEPIYACSFGSDSFIDVIKSQKKIDIFCHHAADVTNYKSADFDIVTAVGNNTRRLSLVISELKKKSCHKIVLSGSVFEFNEGKGSLPLIAFSPYGLSKGLTSEIFKYYSNLEKIHLGKFVIPNPFGPYEEEKFTMYLARSWLRRERAEIKTPSYVRDNIHASLLAKAYSLFVNQFQGTSYSVLHPSGYPESQGDFALRMSRELKKRFSFPCELTLAEQTHFTEPKTRINYDILDTCKLDWDEQKAWDDLAEYYMEYMG